MRLINTDKLNEYLYYKEIYNKAINDLVEKIELNYLGVHPDELYEKYYPREICNQVKELAEQLKVENENKQPKQSLIRLSYKDGNLVSDEWNGYSEIITQSIKSRKPHWQAKIYHK